jgi:hypothetical protein
LQEAGSAVYAAAFRSRGDSAALLRLGSCRLIYAAQAGIGIILLLAVLVGFAERPPKAIFAC